MTIPRDTLERQAERIQKLEEPMKFWLLATPYTKYPHGQEAAFWLAVEHRGFLLRAGVPCFSPIVHSHPIAHHCGFDVHDVPFWLLSDGQKEFIPIFHSKHPVRNGRAPDLAQGRAPANPFHSTVADRR
jgi:hypothetical protein